MRTELFFESAGDERCTPQRLFDDLHAEFQFDIDCAASIDNAKLPLFFGFGGVATDALEEDWGGMTCWLNPPYSVAGAFVKKAREEADKGATVVLLLPSRTDTKYWHKYIWDERVHNWHVGVEGRFIPGRLCFELKVPVKMRKLILDSMTEASAVGEQERELLALVETTGLPKMAIKRICAGALDEDLLDSAPFPSCVIIFRKIA